MDKEKVLDSQNPESPIDIGEAPNYLEPWGLNPDPLNRK